MIHRDAQGFGVCIEFREEVQATLSTAIERVMCSGCISQQRVQ